LDSAPVRGRNPGNQLVWLGVAGLASRSNPVACEIAEKVGQGATQQPSINMALSDLTHEDMLIYYQG